MKKPFWKTTLGKIAIMLGKIGLASLLKNQKFNKTDKDEKRIDDIINKIP